MSEDKKDRVLVVPFDSFCLNVEDQAVGKLVQVDRLPTKEELLGLTGKPFETIFVATDDGLFYAAMGEEDDTRFELLQKQLSGKKISKIGHTHDFKDLGSEEKSLFFLSLPSVADLTSKASGAEEQYIFNSFGRVTFWPVKNLGPVAQNEFEEASYTQQMIGNAMRVAAKEARKKGLKDIVEIINFIGDYTGRMFGARFKFERWEDVDDPFSS